MPVKKRIRKQERQSRRKLLIVLLLVSFLFLLIFGLGKRLLSWARQSSWDGKSQINLAISQEDNGILLLVLTPGKQSVLLLSLPANLLVQNSSLGTYQAGKLALLAEQEGSDNIFAQSLEYTLNIPIDKIGTKKQIRVSETGIDRSVLKQYFLKQFSFDNWRIWRYLGSSGLTWKTVSLADYALQKSLPDGSLALELDSLRLTRDYSDFLTDPLIKNEGLTISVFNIGFESGTAQKIADLLTNFGVRVVEVSSLQTDELEQADCLLVLSDKESQRTWLVRRLRRIFDCQTEVGEGSGMGEIEILVKSVRI
ncbi:MAG: hypothetical protein ABID04_02800 [Patescibacteria group bacterium]